MAASCDFIKRNFIVITEKPLEIILGSRGTTFQKKMSLPSCFEDGCCPVLKLVEDVSRSAELVLVSRSKRCRQPINIHEITEFHGGFLTIFNKKAASNT